MVYNEIKCLRVYLVYFNESVIVSRDGIKVMNIVCYLFRFVLVMDLNYSF